LSEYSVYHACSTKGGQYELINKAPFHSNKAQTQWLTQGYYFWRSQKLAEQWGETHYKRKKVSFAVLKAKLKLSEEEIFDLVSNSEHIEYFEKLLSKFMNFQREQLGKEYNPTVSACLEYFRNKSKLDSDILPYLGVMAAEEAEEFHKKKRQFVSGMTNCIAINKRIQICLFEGNEDRIIEKQIVYPETWVAKS
jgi:predicted CopG family antitoxin